jgi:hypothetical protein
MMEILREMQNTTHPWLIIAAGLPAPTMAATAMARAGRLCAARQLLA